MLLSLYSIFLMSCVYHSSFAFEVGQHGGKAEVFLSGRVRPASEFITGAYNLTCQFIFKSLMQAAMQIIEHSGETGKSVPHFIVSNLPCFTICLLQMFHFTLKVFQLLHLFFRVLYCALHLFQFLVLVNELFPL